MSDNGVVTAVSSGTVIVLAINDGTPGFTTVRVRLSNADADGDGMSDEVELSLGLDPNDPTDAVEDMDRDGLTSLQEIAAGTEPRNPDTDGDGLNDGREVNVTQTSPIVADTDGDLIPDGIEVQTGTDPQNPASFDLSAALNAIEVTPATFTLTLNAVDLPPSLQLRVIGRLIDGETAIDLTSTQRGTVYTAGNPSVCALSDVSGRVTAQGGGACEITVVNNGRTATSSGTVEAFSPAPLSSVAIPGFANSVDVAGGFAYVAAGATGLQIVDVADRNAPVVVAASDTPGNANDVVVVTDVAYVADGSAGLVMVNVSDPLAPAIVGSLDTPGTAWDVVVRGSRAYVADGANGLRIVDVGNPALPTVVGTLALPGVSKGVDVDAGRSVAVVVGTGGTHSISLANEVAPARLATIAAFPNDGRDVTIVGAFAFVADNSFGLRVFDLTNPNAPVVSGALPITSAGRLQDVAVRDALALGADTFFVNAVPVVGVAAPANPTLRGSLNFATIRADDGTGIALDQRFVYLTAGQGTQENGSSGDTRLYIGQYRSVGDDVGVPPTVSILAPTDGSSMLEGTSVSVVVEATDDVLVDRVELLVDGQTTGVRRDAPYRFSVMAPFGSSTLTLSAVATDLGNNVGVSRTVTLAVNPDEVAPTGALSNIDAGESFVAGASVPIVATATDNVAVASVSLVVNGQSLSTDLAAPFEFLFGVPRNMAALSIGVEVIDAVGNRASSAVLPVVVVPDSATTVEGVVENRTGQRLVGADVDVSLRGASVEVFDVDEVLSTLPDVDGRSPDRAMMVSSLSLRNPNGVFGSDPFGFGVSPSRVIRLSGVFRAPVAGSYSFRLGVNAGGRLTIRGETVVDLSTVGTVPFQESSGSITLPAGDSSLEIVAFDNGNPEVALSYVAPGGVDARAVHPDELRPAARLYRSSSGTDGRFVIPGVPTVLGNLAAFGRSENESGEVLEGGTSIVPPVAGGSTDVGTLTLYSFPVWTQRLPVVRPPALISPAATFDAARGEVMLFGGLTNPNNQFANQTWVWNGTEWSRKQPPASPSPRSSQAMAYDPVRGEIVLFGGYNTSSLFDTWVWDGSVWTQKTPASRPPRRYAGAMVYDQARGELVLFGGRCGTCEAGTPDNTSFADTWVWNGTNWIARTPMTSPPARREHAMAYDSRRGEVVLFGGVGTNGVPLNDTWVWDGVNWSQKAPALSPPARYVHTMSEWSGGIAVFGGRSATPALWGDTWIWNGTTWRSEVGPISPVPREAHSMAFDAVRG
ncbi:MAG: kelch repeat-containing protein, partial [Micropepsaceae bacterium]